MQSSINKTQTETWIPWAEVSRISVEHVNEATAYLNVEQYDGSSARTITLRLNNAILWKLIAELLIIKAKH